MQYFSLHSKIEAVQEKSSLFFLVSLLFSFVIAYAPVLKDLVNVWYYSDDYSHGFFILPISAFIIWQKRNELTRVDTQPSNWGLVFFLLSLSIYVAASFAEIQTLKSITIVPLWAGVVLYLWGYQMVRAVLFPLFFLFCMIPIPAQIYASLTVPLQLIVSKISFMLTSTAGVPIFAEGNVLYLPGRTLEVVEACSGLRSLISLFVLTLVLGYFTLQSNLLRSVLIISTIPIAILVNVVRVSLIVVALYYLDFDLTVGVPHIFLGLCIFLLALSFVLLEKRIFIFWNR